MKSRLLFKEEVVKKEERNQDILEAKKALNNLYSGTLEIFGKEIKLDREIAHGGFKLIFDIGNGKVLALRNINDGVRDHIIFGWQEGVAFEYGMSKKLQDLGLHAQDYQQVEVKIDGHKIPALVMSHFKTLLSRNLQLRGPGINDNYGTTQLFATKENLLSESYFKLLCTDVIKDIIILISNKVNLPYDAFGGVIIQDTLDTPAHDRDIAGTLTERKQKVRLFFMDFYQKNYIFQKRNLVICDERFNPNLKEIKRAAEYYLGMGISQVLAGMTDLERDHMKNDPDFDFNEAEYNIHNKMKHGSLLDDICNGVIQELKHQKIAQFDKVNRLKRSISCNSVFYKPVRTNNEPELNHESLQKALFDDESDEEFDRSSLRNTIG